MKHKIFIIFAFLLLIFVPHSFAQNSKCNGASAESVDILRCANQNVEFTDVYKVKLIQGKIFVIGTEEPLLGIIDIYIVSKVDAKSEGSDLVKQTMPFRRFKTNERGEFCLTDIPKGNYVLKVGTKEGNFNCAWLKVKVTKNGSEKPIEIDLIAGT